jgi:small subunit ribosomal protein S20
LAHSRSAEKRYRQSLDRQVRNRSVRSAARTHVSKALGLIKTGALPEAETAVREAVSVLDQAQKKGVIHGNNAARRKSRLMARYNAALAAAAVAQAEVKVEVPPREEPAEVGRRRRLGRKPAEKPPAKAAKPAADAKGRAKASKPAAKKEDKPKKKEDKPKPKKKEDKPKKK